VPFERVVGIYDADGTLRGELAYLLGRARGTAHCALCDITHGRLRRRPDFDVAVTALDVPFELRHRDEVDDVGRAAAGGRYPCVVGIADGRGTVLLDADELERCEGDPATMVELLVAALQRPT